MPRWPGRDGGRRPRLLNKFSQKESSCPARTFPKTDRTRYEAKSSPLAKGSPPQCLVSWVNPAPAQANGLPGGQRGHSGVWPVFAGRSVPRLCSGCGRLIPRAPGPVRGQHRKIVAKLGNFWSKWGDPSPRGKSTPATARAGTTGHRAWTELSEGSFPLWFSDSVRWGVGAEVPGCPTGQMSGHTWAGRLSRPSRSHGEVRCLEGSISQQPGGRSLSCAPIFHVDREGRSPHAEPGFSSVPPELPFHRA